MIDAFGAIGPRHLRGIRARKRSERWLMDIITSVRRGTLNPGRETSLYAFSWHRKLNAQTLETRQAAIELLNVIRPIVAIAYYIGFAALALHEYPECRAALRSDDPLYSRLFVHEVRRFYPFAPLLGAKARHDFSWKSCPFKKGQLVLLDIYGTNHDPALWPDPEIFNPERFCDQEPGAYNYLPQGGGELTGHRCPGEGITITLLEQAAKMLACDLSYEMPPQDLGFSLSRMPTYPRSGVILEMKSEGTSG